MSEIEEIAKSLAEIDKILHERVRLAITTILFHMGKASFNTLKRMLETSEGNLATHLGTLEQAGYIKVEKRFINRKPQTTYKLTDKGKKAYREYLEILTKIFLKQKIEKKRE